MTGGQTQDEAPDTVGGEASVEFEGSFLRQSLGSAVGEAPAGHRGIIYGSSS